MSDAPEPEAAAAAPGAAPALEAPAAAAAAPGPSVWTRGDFRKLWAGQLVTQLGSEVTLLAIPLLAVAMGVSPLEMGVLVAIEFLPALLLGLPIGVLVDRHKPKTFMVVADLARAALLGALAVLWNVDRLEIWTLCTIGFLLGTFRMMFDVSYGTIVPSILDEDQILDGNAKLGLARSVSELSGPPLGGFLVQALTAGTAVVVDAASFLVSGIAISMMSPRPVPRPPADEAAKPSFVGEMVAGVRAVLGHEVRRLIIASAALWNLFYCLILAVFVLHVVRTLGVSPWLLGLSYVPGGLGFMLGATLAPRVARRIGTGRTTFLGVLSTTGWGALAGMATGGMYEVAGILMAATFLFGFGQALFNISAATIMQTVTARDILGRVNSVASVLYRSTLPIGGMIGGVLGEHLGMRTTVMIGALGLLASAGILALRPVRTFQLTKS
jgi:MFS family permease